MLWAASLISAKSVTCANKETASNFGKLKCLRNQAHLVDSTDADLILGQQLNNSKLWRALYRSFMERQNKRIQFTRTV